MIASLLATTRRLWHWYLYEASAYTILRMTLYGGLMIGLLFGFWLGRATAQTIVLPKVPGVYQGPGCAGHPARPPSSYTSSLKVRQIRELDYTDTNPASYEEDHLVQLSLGGNPTSPDNLWPQPWVQARRDDKIEYQLYLRACRGIGRPLTVHEAVRWEKVWKRRHG